MTCGRVLLLLTHPGPFFSSSFYLFYSLLFLCTVRSLLLPFFSPCQHVLAPLDPDASLSFVPEAAVIELNTDYESYLLYSCQNSCQKQWIKIKSGGLLQYRQRGTTEIFSHFVEPAVELNLKHLPGLYSPTQKAICCSPHANRAKRADEKHDQWEFLACSPGVPNREIVGKPSFTFWTLFLLVKSNRSRKKTSPYCSLFSSRISYIKLCSPMFCIPLQRILVLLYSPDQTYYINYTY